jgi:hypothetical protein
MTRARRHWLSGLAVGATAGFATLEIPSLGWLLVVAFVVPAAISALRLASIGGLLTAIGAIWIVLIGRVALTCRTTGDELGCQASGIEPWLVAGATMFAIGLLLTILAMIRSRHTRADTPVS